MAGSNQQITFRVADRIAINTLLFYTLGFAVGLATAYKLLPRFVNALKESRCWPCFHRRAYRGSGNQRGPFADLLDNPRRIGRHRVVLLFSSSLLIVAECISGFRHYFELWTTGWANTFLLNMIRLFTISFVGLFVMIATVYRISLLIITHPVHRKWAVWGMISLLCSLQLLGVGCVAWVLWGNRHLDVVTWQNLVVVPVWMAGFLLLVPLAVIVLSLWSLKIAFTAVQDAIGVITLSPDTTLESNVLAKPSPSALASSNNNGEGATSHAPPSPVATQVKVSSQDSTQTVPSLSPDNAAGSEGRSAANDGTCNKKRRQSAKQRQTVMYHVGRSFKIMTLLLTAFWAGALFFIVTFRPFPIYSVSVVALLCALAIAVEAGFDWLITVNRTGAKQMIRRTVAAGKAAVVSSKVVSGVETAPSRPL